MTTATTTLQAHAIDAEVLDRMRAAGTDDFGNPLVPWTAVGDPLRCCLRPAHEGDAVALISYSPHRRPSVWAEAGPVFVHMERCSGWDPADGLPSGLRTGPRVLRSYHGDGSLNYDAIRIVPDGEDVEPVLADLFDRGDVAEVHVRAVAAQCFRYAVRRSLVSGV